METNKACQDPLPAHDCLNCVPSALRKTCIPHHALTNETDTWDFNHKTLKPLIFHAQHVAHCRVSHAGTKLSRS